MKSSLKTLAMWLVIGVIFIVLATNIIDNSDTKMDYSDLLTNIENENVKQIEIEANSKTAYVTLKNSNTEKRVNIPNVESFMDYEQQKISNGEFKLTEKSQSIFITALSLLSPFGIVIIMIIFWFLIMNQTQGGRKQNNDLWKKQGKNNDTSR